MKEFSEEAKYNGHYRINYRQNFGKNTKLMQLQGIIVNEMLINEIGKCCGLYCCGDESLLNSGHWTNSRNEQLNLIYISLKGI